MTILLILTLLQTSTKQLDIKDLYSSIIHAAITREGKTFWISIEGRGAGRTNDLYMFDHNSRKILKVNTDFTTLDVYCRLIPMRAGFALIDKHANVYILNDKGEFQEQFSIKQMEGCPSNLKFFEAQHKEGSVFALTYRDLEQVSDLFLAEVDLENRTFETVFVKHHSPESSYWLHCKDRWYSVSCHTGEIIELDNQFRNKKTLVPKREPILTVDDKKIADMLISQGVSPYLELVRAGSTVGDTTYFWRFHQQSKNGLVLHQLALRNGVLTVVNHGRMVLAKYKDGALEFDRDEQEFKLTSKP